MNMDTGSFESSDIYLLAAILTCVEGSTLDDKINRNDPKHVLFCVHGNPVKIAEVRDAWWENNLDGNLREYMLQLKRVKSLVHGGS